MADPVVAAPLGHAAMAKLLVNRFGGVIRWVPDLRKGEFVYFDGRWHGEEGCHDRVVDMLSNTIVAAAGTLDLSRSQLMTMTSTGYIENVIRAVRTQHVAKLHRWMAQWDQEPEEIQTPKHIWNLETGTARAITPQDFKLQCTRFEPDNTMATPMHDALLANCFRGCPEDRLLFEDCIGGALRGINPEQRFCWLIGTPGCGKSSTLMIAIDLLGSYAQLGDVSILVTPMHGHSDSPVGFAMADLAEKRLLLFDEAPLVGRVNAPVLKKLANGFTQRIAGKYQVLRTGQFYATPFLVTNQLIERGLEGEDGRSVRRRLTMIRADGPEIPRDAQTNAFHALIVAEEGPGVLAWYIEQARLHHERRLFGAGPPAGSMTAEMLTEEFTNASGTEHVVTEWVEEALNVTGNHNDFIPLSVMWRAFGEWWLSHPAAEETALHAVPMSRGNFYGKLGPALGGRSGVERAKGPQREGSKRNFVDGFRGVVGV